MRKGKSSIMVLVSLLTACGAVVALLWLGLSLAPTVRAATPVYVRPDGDDTCNGTVDAPYTGGTDCAFATISQSVSSVDAGGTVIVAAGTYTENVTIGKNVTIRGAGAGSTVVDGDGSGRVVDIGFGNTVAFTGMTLQNGNADFGGGVRSWGSVLTLEGVTVLSNTATSHGGGVYNNGGTVILSGTAILDNQAAGGGGGICNDNLNATLILTGSLVALNTSDSSTEGGGGIYQADDASALRLTGSTVVTNTATGGQGAGIYQQGGSGVLVAVTLRANRITAPAKDGGGIYYDAAGLTITDSLIISNTASRWGGGAYVANTLSLVDSAVVENTANDGGGIYNQNANTMTLVNVTLSGNSAANNGGGLAHTNGTADLLNVTVAGNLADADNNLAGQGGGLYQSGGTVNLLNTLIGDNAGSGVGPDCSGLLTSQDYNLVEDTANCTLTGTLTHVITGSDPRLGPLQDNGGDTLTQALLEGSPAIDAGDDGTCPPTDQRGEVRPLGAGCDVGAYEYRTCYARLNDDPTDYTTVQAAVDASTHVTDVVKVAGTCAGISARPVPAGYDYAPASGLITQVVCLTKSLTLRGGYTPTNWSTAYPVTQPTTLDAQSAGRVLVVVGEISPTIEGLRITGGDAAGQAGGWWAAEEGVGGGVYVRGATAVLSGNAVYSNTAFYYGGGMYLNASDSTISGNTIFSNVAISDGGGGLYIHEGTLSIDNNVIHHNYAAGWGGGIRAYETAGTLSNNEIYANRADTRGGGLTIGGSCTLKYNHIYSNTAYRGGGLDVYFGSGGFEGNLIADNSAAADAGGVLVENGGPTFTNTVVINNVVTTTGGTGSGIRVQGGNPRLVHTTVARNRGGDDSGVYVTEQGVVRGEVAMIDTIIFSHTVGVTATAGNTLTLDATLWASNTTAWGGNVFHTRDYTGTPAFAADGYHLTTASAAMNRGVDAGAVTDVDGENRPLAGGFDLGADEVPCTVLTGVTIAGPATGLLSVTYPFTASVTPGSPSSPTVYTWSPVPDSGQGAPNATYVWATEGNKTISVTVSNCGGTVVTDDHPIEISKYRIFLPLVLRNG